LKLTPLDIKKQEFRKVLRGYDPLEVETFLEMVADEYESLQKEVESLRAEVRTLQTQLKDYQQVEQTLKQTLMNAQESINRARMNTEKEASLIIHEAELKAEKILDEARREVERLRNDIVLLRSQKESLARRLKHLLESQLELIEVLAKEDADLERLRSREKEEKAKAKIHAAEPEVQKTAKAPEGSLEEDLSTEGVEPEQKEETRKTPEVPDEDQMIF